ncbi:hypothetical protein Ae201684P_018842 [Aphanomyces euteiches]|uniref:Uncharacterized protein n=1 Tax=Aphanomyces euteiches TaxID=100861 RepID=A0A6G0XVM2_9STRA|nr:hypothetical protein Ae201684_000984 [Aphanomyces euteiches]KAH9099833.1 hypothetical protein Ae201684P_018842 [Aphanomyces euteiches]
MIALAPNQWVLALHVQRIIGSLQPEALTPIIAQLQWEIQIPTRRPCGYLLPRWIYQMKLTSFPTLAPHDILLSQWMGGPNGARFAGPLGHRTTQVPSPLPQHIAWWIDATYQPYPPTWWSQLGQELSRARLNGTSYSYLLVVFDQSPGHRFRRCHGAKWHVTIPPGAMAMRHQATIVQDTLPKWQTLSRMNTHAIHIGAITPGDDLPAVEAWYCILRSQGKTHWLHSYPGPQAPPLPALWLSQIHWSPILINPSDPYATSWQTFPTATLQTALWANALSPMRPAQFHRQWFRTTWSTLRAHWLTTCAHTISMIEQHGEQAALLAANRMIWAKRKAHDQRPVGHEARMTKRQSTVTRTATLWHNHRSMMLDHEPSHANKWPARRNRRRPPRKPPDSPPG